MFRELFFSLKCSILNLGSEHIWIKPITIYNRDPTGVVKAKFGLDVNLPLVRKVHITLEDGERIKIAIFYLGFHLQLLEVFMCLITMKIIVG